MNHKWSIGASLIGWMVAWAFWLCLTYRFHPTFTLALIVTTSLIVAFAGASYCNHLLFVPRYWALNKPWVYVCWLATTMAIFTAIALAIIRVAYAKLFGPDADSYGVYKHFAIDFFGMVVHVAIAAFIVWSTRQFARMIGRPAMKAKQSDRLKPISHEFES